VVVVVVSSLPYIRYRNARMRKKKVRTMMNVMKTFSKYEPMSIAMPIVIRRSLALCIVEWFLFKPCLQRQLVQSALLSSSLKAVALLVWFSILV